MDEKKEVLVEGKVQGSDKAPKHGDVSAGRSPHESVLGVRVGSEASVASGTDPVLPSDSGALGALTKVHNKDLQARDKKEREKRGPDGGVHDLSVSFSGLMAVEVDGEVIFRSGSYTGRFQESFLVRPMTEAEIKAELGGAAPADKPASERRASDLIKGAGQGGGGNPMKAGEARGVTGNPTQPASGRTQPLGTGTTTSRGSGR